ncbi:MAG: bifunctional hydroxymethylpyrimidine kinase/phosphomethylpyrimidine kinase [Alphaproteobacteria bacterium]|nr:bifunctional hydroxymethylpyrimidine kinase/phosphomethylpyrimidine kinase [Alphaproteobacteria bacterium]
MTPPTPIPIALTIAGSDSGGGAGVQADLKTFQDLGVFGTSALTAVTAQNTLGVTWVHAIPIEGVRAQLRALFLDLPPAAIKIGMLATRALVEAVAEELEGYAGPIVLDPVMVATSGDRLLDLDAVGALRDTLLPRCTLATPNLPELELLGGQAWLERAPIPVLVKGGHAEGDVVVDVLHVDGAQRRHEHPRVHTRNTHGTGCTLSSAIAAQLALGHPLEVAVSEGLDYVGRQLQVAATHDLGGGHGPLLHGLARRDVSPA